jgi:hypothetical protein
VISAPDVAATLEYLLPGFIAIKVFTFFGLRSTRTDLELTLWSLAASVPLGWAGARVNAEYANGVALLLGIAMAGIAAYAWNNWSVLGALRTASASTARAAILQKGWIQVTLSNGEVLSGRLRLAAEPTSDDQDLYIDEPAWIRDGKANEMEMTAGVIIPGAAITYIQVLGEAAEA